MLRNIIYVAAALTIAAPAMAAENEETLKATVVENQGGSSTGTSEIVTCSQGNHKRTVSITSKDTEKKVPCEVHYKKETEQPGHDDMIYTANSDASFCEAKAKAFVDKLSGWGWTCN